MLDSYIIGYRNSISNDGLFISFSKIGYWITGIWGKELDKLIETGEFDHEIL